MMNKKIYALALLIICTVFSYGTDYVVNVDGAKVYSGDKVLGTLSKGERFSSDTTNGDWVMVSLKKANGWIAISDLKDNSVPPLPSSKPKASASSPEAFNDEEIAEIVARLRDISPIADNYFTEDAARLRVSDRRKKVTAAMLSDYSHPVLDAKVRRRKLLYILSEIETRTGDTGYTEIAAHSRQINRLKQLEEILLNNIISAQVYGLADLNGSPITLESHLYDPVSVLLALEVKQAMLKREDANKLQSFHNDTPTNLEIEKTLQYAKNGDSASQREVGGYYYFGLYAFDLDYKKAAHWLRLAAIQGDVTAQNYLGVLYAKGLGVERDYNKAIEWYQKSAAQGNVNAKENLDKLRSIR